MRRRIVDALGRLLASLLGAFLIILAVGILVEQFS
jgi:hypothetical protein